MPFGDGGFGGSGSGKIRIVIDKETREIKVEGQGFSGSSCEEAMAWLRELGQVEQEAPTDEYFEDGDQGQGVGVGSGF